NNTVTGNIVSGNSNGIHLYSSSNNNISNNIATNDYGILLDRSGNNNISNNTAWGNSKDGILLYSSNNNTLSNNNASHNENGIHLYSSSNNIVTGNTASENYNGILLYSSGNNILTDNRMVKCGIYMEGTLLHHWSSHIIDTTNTVNDKTLYYLVDQTGGNIPSGAGQIILVNCTGVAIVDQNLSDGSVGVLFAFSTWCNLENSTVSGNKIGVLFKNSNNITIQGNNIDFNIDYGIALFDSCNNDIVDNHLSNNPFGIYIDYGNGNYIVNNLLSYNQFGIYTYRGCSGNVITGNDVTHNAKGVYISQHGSLFYTANLIYRNNFIDNSLHAFDEGGNTWSLPFPVGGNHWSGYEGNDRGDGIGDVPYDIPNDARTRDSSPWVEENGWEMIDTRIYNPAKSTYHATIQDAIEYADEGDALFVSPSIYFENILIDKTITIVGASPENTIIQGNGVGVAITVTASWVNISGFTITGNEMGVALVGSTNCTISNNSITNNWLAVYLEESHHNTITNNTLASNDYGVGLWLSNYNSIRDNNASYNTGAGIGIWESDNNTVLGNTFSFNEYGAHLEDSMDNIIYHNNFIDNTVQAWDNGNNNWNMSDPSTGGLGGNYWNDYTGEDRGDGIGDTPYGISGGDKQDDYPWIEQDGWA
ncbi:MAG: NosD domain-containing protein, partial [Candidatus Thermoplasmatota archaeon]|nr:NosD domain-containing protein [Candidatus Thermoplasmatota archaeon]